MQGRNPVEAWQKGALYVLDCRRDMKDGLARAALVMEH